MHSKIFISYSHDSEVHKENVLGLADRLRNEGVNSIIDQYEESPAVGWTRWAMNQIDESEFVLVVCTQQYSLLFSGKKETIEGKPANWQGAIITQSIYDSQSNHTKFIPITFSEHDFAHIPMILRSATSYTIDTDYEQLYRRLTNQFDTPMPVLGAIRQLPHRDHQQYFLDADSQNSLKEEFLNASKGLLSWNRKLGDNQQIIRPELAQLTERIKTETSSTTIVLGSPGCGKSALMATLGHWAVEEKYALLAIKADYLSNTVNTIEDLQRDIQLSRHPKDAIKAIGNSEKVILLIDQLDAVSELLDRQPGRINVLLAFIQSLTGTKNIHIVATCREFEFRYGTQFARLDNCEPLKLELPEWKDISPLLEKEQHNPNSMGAALCELLKNPLHLKIFLEIAKPGETFESFPKLLDRLWEKHISHQSKAQQLIDFLTQLADRMADEEVLWLPSAIADEMPDICRALEQAGILMTNQDSSTLGFRHQTFYDHTLARAFAHGAKSLADFVLERQDGLFIRPILLRSLNYLRGTAPQQYKKQLQILLNDSPQEIRSHIRTLLIEFIGGQPHPNSDEAGLLIPLLNSETEGIKVLDSIIASPGWFTRLRDRPEFRQWLEKPVEQAVYGSPILTAATNFASEDVWSLLEEYWLDDKTYDFLSIRAIWNIGQWTPERVFLTQQVIQRSNIQWDDVSMIAERIGETLPNYATRVIRGHLDCLLIQAMEASQIPIPVLPPDVDEVERSIHNYRHDPLKPLRALLESERNFYEIEKFAEAYPQSFLESIWSWFIDLIQKLSYDINPLIISYRLNRVGDFRFSRSEIVLSLITAITELAKFNKIAFFEFFEQNTNSDLLVIHRLLAYGLEAVAPQDPSYVLDYLLADPRRFGLGGQMMGSDRHKETETLITAIFPYLNLEDRQRLEQKILEFKFWQPTDDMDVDFRRRSLEYNREHRLSLLQAIPEENLSSRTKRLKEEEERALPWFEVRKSSGTIRGGIVGPRMTKAEMSLADDRHLINLFNKLSDETEWEAPHHRSSDEFSRSGGAIQQSREFGELVKDDPSRFLPILPALEPHRHESYVGRAIEELAGTDYTANGLIDIIERLDRQGFVSESFRSEASHALEKIAERNQGLPQSSLSILKGWLPTHSQPELAHYKSTEEKSFDLNSPILFGIFGSSHMLPGGRGNIVRAIAKGYLKQSPPDHEGWATFIRSQIGIETHPAVWVDILSEMPPLLNGDPIQATELFDIVIRNCPEALQYQWALYFIAHTIGWFKPKETVQGWLEMLRANNSSFSQQAYGELLLIHYLQYQDEWSVEQINQHLATQNNEAILCGLAHAASHLWVQNRCRAIAHNILYNLVPSSSESIQNAVASVFRWSRDSFRLDPGMMKVIHAICENRNILLEAANDLIEIIEEENLVELNPEVVAKICENLLKIGSELTNPIRPTALIAESLTTIAIQLHRQDVFRERGLQIFEQLLAQNLRETQAILETLDRKPIRLGLYSGSRKRLRSRRKRHP
jgi:hypothetical protein